LVNCLIVCLLNCLDNYMEVVISVKGGNYLINLRIYDDTTILFDFIYGQKKMK